MTKRKRKVTNTDTTNGDSPRQLLINRIIPEITPVAIPPIDQTITEDAAGSGGTLHALHTILMKEIVTDPACSSAHVFRNFADVSRHGTGGTTPRDGNNVIGSIGLASPVRIGDSNTGSPRRTGSQYIISPRGSIGPQWSRDAQPLETSINRIYSKHRYPTPTWSKVIGRKFTKKSSTDVNSRSWMNLMRDAFLTESLNFVNLGILSVHTPNELGSVFIPTNIIVAIILVKLQRI